MISIKFIIILVSLFTTISLHAQPFANEIAAFKKADSVSFPPKKAILFIGSSSFRLWENLQSSFPTYNLINRAFGGSTLPDVIRYEKEVIFPYQPRQIIIYCGENDLATSDSVTGWMVFDRFRKLFNDIRKHLGKVPIAFVSIKPSPSRRHLRGKVEEANTLIQNFLKNQKKAVYIDVFNAMLRPDGSDRPELFKEDMLHMNKAGYEIWQKLIEPHLLKK